MRKSGPWSLAAELHAYAIADTIYDCDVHVGLTPDGRRIVTLPYSTSYYDSALDNMEYHPLVWDADTGELLLTLRHAEKALFFGLSPTSKYVFTSGDDNKGRTWDIETGEVLATIDIDANTEGPNSGLFVKHGEGRFRIIDPQNGNELRSIRDGGSWERYALGAGGQVVVEGSREGWAQFWNSNGDLHQLLGSGPIVGNVAVSTDGARIAVGTTVGEVHVWNSAGAEFVATVKQPEHSIDDVILNADGQVLVASLHNGPLLVKNLTTGKSGRLDAYRRYGNHVGISADGKRIVVGQPDGSIDIWDAARGRTRKQVWRSATQQIGSPSPVAVDATASRPDGFLARLKRLFGSRD